jgi:hypothetical protein
MAGRKVLVQFVLTSMLIYLIMAMDLPSWALKPIDKIRRGFPWKGRKDVIGGHYLIAWPKVARPPNLGGLGLVEKPSFGLPRGVGATSTRNGPQPSEGTQRGIQVSPPKGRRSNKGGAKGQRQRRTKAPVSRRGFRGPPTREVQ